MRVIAGKARRLPLKTVKGMNTRPTTDRIKETLFNIIHYAVSGASFLDLYSGSGAIGIEALSRGAKKAVFIENNREAIECIRHNLQFTGLEQDAEIYFLSVDKALQELQQKHAYFDIVFMDPPYHQEYEKDVLIFLKKSDLIDKNSLIIVEASLDTDFSYVNRLGYDRIREKKYKTNKHIFLKVIGDKNEKSNLSGQF